MNSRIHGVVIVLAAWVMGCSAAQPPTPLYSKVTPAHPSVSAAGLIGHQLTYEKAGYTMRYAMAAGEYTGKPVWQLDVFFNPTPGSAPDTLYLDRKTLAFVGRHLAMQDYSIKVHYEAGHFSGELTPTAGSSFTPVVYDKVYPHGAFEPAVINYAIAALPLAEGYRASIPVFDLNDGSQMFWSNVDVQGSEKLSIDGQEFDTWKVRSAGIRNKTLWISKQHGVAVKMITEGNPGAWYLVPSSIQWSQGE